MKTVLLKISGELLGDNTTVIQGVIAQLKELHSSHRFGIVIGGGNFFRGTQHGAALNITRNTSDAVGMLATVMNALMLHDLSQQAGITTKVLSSIVAPQIADTICPSNIAKALENNEIIIFAGGTGCAYVTTDTNAVIRGLQIGATELWKATKVDGIYSADPARDATAQKLPKVSYQQAIDQRLGVMDVTALTLAQENGILTRVFNIFADTALVQVAKDKTIGSTIT